MSSLSVSGLSQGLNQWFGSSSAASSASSTTSASNSAPASPTSAGAASPATQGTAQQIGGHHRHGHGGGKLFQQIQDAVTSALQSAKSGSGNSDPNQVIEDAIAKVFKQAGKASPTGAVGAQQAADSSSDDNVDAPGEADASNSSQTAFLKTLQSLGVSPQQFKTDFAAAVKDAQQSGNLDVSAALKSLPKGSTLDAIG
jgi:hypothetical protein